MIVGNFTFREVMMKRRVTFFRVKNNFSSNQKLLGFHTSTKFVFEFQVFCGHIILKNCLILKVRSHGAIFSECDYIFKSNRSLTV